ncbi:conserved oligomeric Golgi complex subunit 3-like isoform X2 [Gordionus sp. m RMFG-2023]|uniref:conserved oligomeric Golgi complex subunit 3-like isoform X2 n=1 Tax=Gordionus sp. m RMFG-2023 TaxID=3053472 RepID=UPI0031FE38D2
MNKVSQDLRDNDVENLKISQNLSYWEHLGGNKQGIAPLKSQDIDTYFFLNKISIGRPIKKDFANSNVNFMENLLSKNSLMLNDFIINNDIPKNHYDTPMEFYKSMLILPKINLSSLLNPYKEYSYMIHNMKTQTFEPIKKEFEKICIDAQNIKLDYSQVNMIINALHHDCESIKLDKKKYQDLLDHIDKILAVFERVDNMQERLIETESLPLGYESCISMFDQISKDMRFLRSKTSYKDSPIYLAKSWKQANKILNIIKSRVFKIIDDAFKAIDVTNADIVTTTEDHLNSCNDSDKSYFYNSDPIFKDTFNSDDAFVRFYAKFKILITDRCKNFIRYLENYKYPKKYENEMASAKITTLVERLDIIKEIGSILNDCKLHYLSKREKLLFPIIQNTMYDLMLKHTFDHCNLVRNACSFFSNLYNDEINLYHHIFSIRTPDLRDFLERMCYIFYESIKTRIVKIKHLETLSELCSVLRDEMNFPSDMREETDNYLKDEQNHDISNQPDGSKPINVFDETISKLVGDVRERLVFITHIYVQNDIRNYVPSQGDLAYPEKLNMIKDITESLKSAKSLHDISRNSVTMSERLDVSQLSSNNYDTSDTESVISDKTAVTNSTLNDKIGKNRACSIYSTRSIISNNSTYLSNTRYSNSPYELYGLWYTTVRRSVICLSKLNRCLDKSVFQSLSQDVLNACLESLTKASSLIRNKSSLLDSQLFLVKHLLILREQINPFQTRFAQKEIIIDFPNVKDAAIKMFHHQKLAFLSFKNNAFLEFILNSSPSFHERYLDSRKLVDENLIDMCQSFIRNASLLMTGTIDELITQLRKHQSSPQSLNATQNTKELNYLDNGHIDDANIKCLQNSPTLPDGEEMRLQMSTAYKTFKENAKFVKISLALYLANPDTEFILFKPLKMFVGIG